MADFLRTRTAKPNLALLDPLPHVEATKAAPPEVALVVEATAAAVEATEGLRPQGGDDKFSSTTFVIPDLVSVTSNIEYPC